LALINGGTMLASRPGQYQQNQILFGILWILAATFLFLMADTLSKLLAATYPVVQVTWFRFVFHLALLAVLLNRRLPVVIMSKVPGRQLIRSALLLAAMLLLILGLQAMPLADLTAVMQIVPLLVTLLGVMLLGEHIGPRRVIGIVAGMTGALIVLRPGFVILQWAALLPVAAAFCFASYQAMTRLVSRDDQPLTSLLWTPVVGTLVLGLMVPWHWAEPDVSGWLLLCSLGIIGAVSQFCLIKAVSAAPVSVVSPYQYSGMIWAVLLGYVVFGDFPDSWTFVGGGLIIASGLYVFYREQIAAGRKS
jgi:drug/metabolite transporter (DMT)-like permease